jgi:hypothetical protein
LSRHPDDIGYDEYEAKAVIAESENDARIEASKLTGDEGDVWNDCDLVKCEEINLDCGPVELLGSFNA